MVSLDHPNVMSLIGVSVDREMPFLIMPFMANGSILEYVKHHKEERLHTSEATAAEVCYSLIHKQLFQCTCFLSGHEFKKTNAGYVSPDSQGNGIPSGAHVCPSRPGSKELHVRSSSTLWGIHV